MFSAFLIAGHAVGRRGLWSSGRSLGRPWKQGDRTPRTSRGPSSLPRVMDLEPTSRPCRRTSFSSRVQACTAYSEAEWGLSRPAPCPAAAVLSDRWVFLQSPFLLRSVTCRSAGTRFPRPGLSQCRGPSGRGGGGQGAGTLFLWSACDLGWSLPHCVPCQAGAQVLAAWPAGRASRPCGPPGGEPALHVLGPAGAPDSRSCSAVTVAPTWLRALSWEDGPAQGAPLRARKQQALGFFPLLTGSCRAGGPWGCHAPGLAVISDSAPATFPVRPPHPIPPAWRSRPVTFLSSI